MGFGGPDANAKTATIGDDSPFCASRQNMKRLEAALNSEEAMQSACRRFGNVLYDMRSQHGP
jgi:hypothetical protein